MTQKTTMRTLLFAIAACGLALAASAQSTGIPAPSTNYGKGLLGQTYVGLGYGYTDLHDSSVNLQALRFEYNQPLNTGFDLNLGYTGTRTSLFADNRNTWQSFDANAVAFLPDRTWGRPYLSVGGGWTWVKNAGVKDNSFLYQLETGVEVQATTALSVTPYVKYLETPSLHIDNRWRYGVKANYWLTSQWGVSAGVGLDNKVNTTYALGVNFRF